MAVFAKTATNRSLDDLILSGCKSLLLNTQTAVVMSITRTNKVTIVSKITLDCTSKTELPGKGSFRSTNCLKSVVIS
jgi:hypothetical protein